MHFSFTSQAHLFAPFPRPSRTTRLTVFNLIKIKYDTLAKIEEALSWLGESDGSERIREIVRESRTYLLAFRLP